MSEYRECRVCHGRGTELRDTAHEEALARMRKLGIEPPLWLLEGTEVEHKIRRVHEMTRLQEVDTEPESVECEFHRPPLEIVGLPRGPVRHGIRWTIVTFYTVLSLYQGSQVFLTADDPAEVAFRALAASILGWIAMTIANRWYRPRHQR